jgi:hypothetical protein
MADSRVAKMGGMELIMRGCLPMWIGKGVGMDAGKTGVS